MNEFDPDHKRAQEILDALKAGWFSPLEGDTHLSRELSLPSSLPSQDAVSQFLDSW